MIVFLLLNFEDFFINSGHKSFDMWFGYIFSLFKIFKILLTVFYFLIKFFILNFIKYTFSIFILWIIILVSYLIMSNNNRKQIGDCLGIVFPHQFLNILRDSVPTSIFKILTLWKHILHIIYFSPFWSIQFNDFWKK